MSSQNIQLIDRETSLPELEQAVESVLQLSKKHGATDAVAAVTIDRGMTVTARMGEVETVEMQADKGVSVTVYRQTPQGTHKGSASTSDISLPSLEKTVAAAIDLANFTEADDCAGLAPVEEMAHEFPDLDLYHPWSVSTETLIEQALACEQAGRDCDRRISNSDGASVSTGVDLTVLGNSRGFSATVMGSGHSLSCALLAENGEEMERDYAWSSARDQRDLEPAEAIGRLAAERAVARLGGRSVSTGQHPVLFDRRLARGLFGSLLSALSGSAQYRKNSFLLDSVGQSVLPAWLSISEQPQQRKGARSSAFDSDAVATRAQSFIEQGVVQQYLLGVYSARKLGLKTTGNGGGARNVQLSTNASTQQELLADMGTGLWVTELMGQGVNSVTGDYSRGASGFWVENGMVQYPVTGVTIAGNLRDMYRQLRGLSADAEQNANINCGAALVDGMTVAGE